MDHIVEFDAPAEKIYQDFTSREYWQTLMDAYRFLIPQSEIRSFSATGRGTDIVFAQHLPRRFLPPLARTVLPGDMIITRKQHYDPYDHDRNRAKGSYSASIPHGPGSFAGQYFLAETDRGSTLRLASICKVHLPFVGGTLEDMILHHIKRLFDAEEAFTADWISKHH
jgi:hypothetical protein